MDSDWGLGHDATAHRIILTGWDLSQGAYLNDNATPGNAIQHTLP